MKTSDAMQDPDPVNPAAPQVDSGNRGRDRSGVSAGGGASGDRGKFVLCALLFLLVTGIFLPALGHDFIVYDDPRYVTKNTHVADGLTWPDVRWAFQSTEASNWHPLTWLSHMADCQLFGIHPWGHHLTNVLLHAINAVLLFVVLRSMTGAVWRSIFVAALFGLHPLHVESVAWVSERKDVLSTAFLMLVLWAYAHRAERLRARSSHAWIFYGLALLFFAMGLMCKPMLVTVPCVLLLLDYWPLKRLEHSSAATRRALLIEKIPFFALSAAASAVTLFAQRNGGTVQSVEDFPWPVRLANALIAYCQYLGKCFVPDRLAVFYPYFGEQPPLWQTLLAALLLVGITVAAVALHRRRPYLLVGWLWFVGTLVPVIGLVQIGGQSMADRYSYVPLIGVFVIVAWAACDATASWPGRRSILGITAGTALITLGALTSRQLGFWKDGVSLFGHAIAVTENNWMAHASLAATLSKSSPSESSAEYQETMRIIAAFAETHDRKGVELDRIPGHASEAIEEFRTAVRIMPVIPGPHYNLGTALAKLPDHLPEAIEEFRTVVRLKPDLADAHYNLGTALANSPGHLPEAIEEFQIVVRLEPDAAEAHYILGRLLASVPGRTDEALGQFESALKIKPDMEQAREMIARLRAAQQ